MEALNYEDLIRRVYGVERYGVRCADADIYREMQASARILECETKNIENREPRLSTESISALQYKYQVNCRRVWGFVQEAIFEGSKRYSAMLTPEDIEALEELRREPKKFTKEAIDDVVDGANAIFTQGKIYVR